MLFTRNGRKECLRGRINMHTDKIFIDNYAMRMYNYANLNEIWDNLWKTG